ncbi:YicC/YloC family endoribonuclease [Aneurinibacillus aneurinilyticus]|uniref:YicC family protein n=2 Tax=Aneurinibacillus aneurinilyticus TaxID=1391 RepID=A0A848CT64_ANEAE|nr:YicC/YloC family endoribonuclease [Aneurinibacillus aneurinilyticus]MCI1692321.1 YicC family protein [Aneurinibacillus aneurinilyticus]MED0707961.1 YicC family protein [Aneurinibacillus aneurinilyticus]MED0722374.1 YicC family protein [Aneurinibacillus aneurinilyticus]MED0734129.1 YicC family protein [Aneurinibacillus aneurinilyticus]MED0742242.1 YicC family protein [Aneurinibacillus aneurinilyticus]
MVYSMTGYGRAERKEEDVSFAVEMRSVNHRFSEVAVRMPREFSAFEDAVRKKVLSYIRRGRVDVFLTVETEAPPSSLKINWELARQYKEAAEKMAELLGVPPQMPVYELLSMPDVARAGEDRPDLESYRAPLLAVVEEAISMLVAMRKKEGQALREDVLGRIEEMKRLVEELALFAPKVAESYRERIFARIQEYIQDRCDIDESRLLHEVAVFTERADISEEITRLRSHFAQFGQIVDEPEAIGRKLDFLVQECHREINTIGAKANHLEISQKVVILKAELEKVKEQVQNIE